jgi:hypothetical protein
LQQRRSAAEERRIAAEKRRCAMDPSAAELQAMADLEAVSDWVGLAANVREAVDVAFGSLTLLRNVVLIPRIAWDQAVMTLRIFGQVAGEAQPPIERPPKAVELGQVESLRRVCRLRLGLPATEAEPGQAAARAPDAVSGPAATGLALGVRKIKLASIMSFVKGGFGS